MKKLITALSLILVLVIPVTSHALLGVVNIEAAAGGWYATPSGNLKYNATDTSDLKNVFGFDSKAAATGRVKLDLPVIPVIYLMATPMEFKGDSKQSFTFNNQSFSTNTSTKLTFNQYDLALYYGVPFLGLATLGSVHVNGGINVRMIEAKGEMSQATSKAEMNMTIPMPMLFVSADVNPTDSFAIEAEVRALSVTNGSALSAIARLKLKALGPLFVTAGYRYEDLSVDKDNFKTSFRLSGPFAEVGVGF